MKTGRDNPSGGAMKLPRPRAQPQTGHDLNLVPPSASFHTPMLHGRATCPEYVGLFLQSPNGPVLCRVGVGHQVLPLIAGDCAPGAAVPNFGLNAHLLGGDPREECPEWLPSVCLPHAQQHGGVDGQAVAKITQGVARAYS